jgi:hypothetical protein
MSIELPDLPIPRQAGPAVQTLMRLFRLEHERFWHTLTPLTVAQLDWRPKAEADSIGMIVDHCVTAERLLIEAGLLPEPRFPPVEVPRSVRVGRSGGGRSGVDAGAYLADLAVQYERAMACMGGLADAQLGRTGYWWWNGAQSTVEEQLEHMIDHLAYHRGQIVYLTMLDGFPAADSSSA